MKKLILLLLLLLQLTGIMGQNKISGYEYWVDDSYASKVSQSFPGTPVYQFNDSIEVTGISPGLHFLHMRFRDDSCQWSSTLTQYFFKNQVFTPAGSRQLVACEYWLDNNYASKVSQSFPGTGVYQIIDSLDMTAVTPGLHFFNVRFQDDLGAWSSTLTQYFLKNQDLTSAGFRQLVTCEYWIDDNYASKVTQSFPGTGVYQIIDSLELTAVSSGLHFFNIRFRDDMSAWSSVLTQFFTKSEGGGTIVPNKIVSWRIWYDNNPASMETFLVTPPINIYQVIDSLETPFLTVGNHLINYQFYDLNQAYSSVRTDTFYVASCLPHGGRSISGPDSLCLGETNIVYEIASIKNAASYHWTVPIGAQIISGQYSPSITVDYPVPVSGNITVYASNSCGNGVSIVLPVNVFAPAIAGQVTGSGSYFFGEEFYPTLEGNVGSVIKWQQRWNGGDWQDVAETGPTYAVIPDTTGTWDFRAVVQSGLCGTVISDFATANVLPATRTVSINLFLEGLFDPSASQMNKAQGEFGDMYPDTVADQIQVKLSRPTYPYATYRIVNNVDLNQDGSCTFTIPRAGSYYLVIKHRNSIETWSSAPVSLLSEPVFYDFTTASSQAYGDNQRDMGGIFTFWGGDVNQDGIVDGGDMNPVDNAVTAITFGYVAEDVNGDGIVDGGDMNIVDNNTTAIIMVLTP